LILAISGNNSTTGGSKHRLDLSLLDRLTPEKILPGRNGTKADILLLLDKGNRVAVKDYRPRSFLVRNTIGRFLIRRETRAYLSAQANGPVEGLAPFLGRPGPFTLATAWLDAVPLAVAASGSRGRLDPDLFDRLDQILDHLHENCFALADLHHRDVLVSAEGDVFIVDLATAYHFQNHFSLFRPMRRSLFRRLCELDRIAAARLRARFTGGDPDTVVEAAGGKTAGLYRVGRKLKARFRSGGSSTRK
jgi:hypothetical protein